MTATAHRSTERVEFEGARYKADGTHGERRDGRSSRRSNLDAPTQAVGIGAQPEGDGGGGRTRFVEFTFQLSRLDEPRHLL